MKQVIFFLLVLVIPQTLYPQSSQFRNPLDIPIQLSANFGEIRTDHYHTGYDIRTQQKTGLKVYASADGYVSRIKISAGGFGRVLYLTHPNGYMTVYAHLEKFNDKIQDYVEQQQYTKESFEIELFPDTGKFPVKQGDIIALSGNSGSSTGPHLHFEIRDAHGESYPLNPKDFLPLKDSVKPTIKAIYIYPLSSCCQEEPKKKFTVIKKNSVHTLKPDSIIVNYRTIGLGIQAEDFSESSSGDQAIYQLETTLDGETVFSMKLDRLDFSKGLYLNAHVDYPEWRGNRVPIHKAFVMPGDKNSIYDEVKNSGKIFLSDTLYHHISIRVSDGNRNSSVLKMAVKFSGKEETKKSGLNCTELIEHDESFEYKKDSFRLNVHSHSLYDDYCFQFKKENSSLTRFSPVYEVGNPNIPLHKNCDLSILPRSLPAALKNKAVIVFSNGNSIRGKTTHHEGDWLVTKMRAFGRYYVVLDTVKPVIKPIGIREKKLITKNELEFSVSDNLSGITSYKALLDGKWYLMEYEPKNAKMIVTLDETVSKGEHILEIIVGDEVNNKTTLKFTFIK